MTEKITAVKAIKTFFEKDDGRKVEVRELKDLSPQERKELGEMCATALGMKLESLLK